MLTMKKLCILLFSISPFVSIAQEKLTKNEIYSILCYAEENRNKIEAHFDSSVVVLIDSLKCSKIDTIGIYSWTLDGSFLKSKISNCEQASWTAYIQWVKNGKTHHQKLNENCKFKPKILTSSILIDFYLNNKILINESRIMPVVTDAYISDKRKFRYTSITTSSSTFYKIYCELNGNSTLKTFEEYQIDNENNLFYLDNKNSIINQWKKLIENQINEIEKE